MVNRDFRDLFAALNDAGAEYLVVGAHAVAFYAEPRFTKDLDVWVGATPANAPTASFAALDGRFGVPVDFGQRERCVAGRHGARTRSTLRDPDPDNHCPAIQLSRMPGRSLAGLPLS